MADQENEQRLRLEQAALASKQQDHPNSAPNQEVLRRNKLNQKKQQVCGPILFTVWVILDSVTPMCFLACLSILNKIEQGRAYIYIIHRS